MLAEKELERRSNVEGEKGAGVFSADYGESTEELHRLVRELREEEEVEERKPKVERPDEVPRVLVVMGTRPEVIKLAPVVWALGDLKREFEQNGWEYADVIVCVTSQHRQLQDEMLHLFGIVPQYDLDIMKPSQEPVEVVYKALAGLTYVIRDCKPKLVICQGDTATTVAAALAARYSRVPVAHVEAGIRSFDDDHPWPEEINRRVVDTVSELLFCPTRMALRNLQREGIILEDYEDLYYRGRRKAYVVGNTGIDTLYYALEKLPPELDWRKAVGVPEYWVRQFNELASKRRRPKIVLVTVHRKENYGERMVRICQAIKELADSLPDVFIILPVHPSPRVQATVRGHLQWHPRILLTDPLRYDVMVAILKESCLVITDSGGLQEEGAALGVPVLVLRETTERWEGVLAGAAKLVGASVSDIVMEALPILEGRPATLHMRCAPNPFGDGKAGRRIAYLVYRWLFRKYAELWPEGRFAFMPFDDELLEYERPWVLRRDWSEDDGEKEGAEE